MAGRENTFKKYLISIMGTRWDVQSHEDQFTEGIPDLSFGAHGVNGWIELKQIKAWPVNAETKVKPSKYTSQQVNWISKRGKRGGNCYVMVKVGKDEYFLFSSNEARAIKSGMTKNEYFDVCLNCWKRGIDPALLLNGLLES